MIETDIPGGEPTPASGQVATQTEAAPVSDSASDKVDYKTYEKAVSQKKNLHARLRELETQAAEREQAKLQEQQKFQQLYEAQKAEADKLRAELDQRRVAETTQMKREALKAELFKLGLNPKHEAHAMRLADLDSLMVDEESKTVIGVDEAARKFHSEFADIGLFQRPGPGVAQNAPRTQVVTDKPLKDLTQEEIKQRLKDLKSQGVF